MILRLRTGTQKGALAIVVVALVGCSGGGNPGPDAGPTPDAGGGLFTIGGTLTGLAAGVKVSLQNNGTDDLTLDANGPFVFKTALATGAPFGVTISSAPPGQDCLVGMKGGTVAAQNITSVTVTCASATYAVGGFVTGLNGNLVLKNNGADPVTVMANGYFEFKSMAANSAAYLVTVDTQPPGQTCAVTAGAGTVSGANVDTVMVTCSNGSFTVGGTVTGLTGAGLVLALNGAEQLNVDASATTFTFVTGVSNNSTYDVTVSTQPAGQRCTLVDSQGTITAASVTGISVHCAGTAAGTTFTLTGTVTYDYVPSLDDVTEGGVKLGYTTAAPRKVRRAVIQAIDSTSSAVLADDLTKDDGTFTLVVPIGSDAKVRVFASSLAVNYVPDAISPDNCSGGSWEVRVVDNTSGQAPYALQGASSYAADTSGIALNAPVTWAAGGYTARAGAPFAILDTVITEIELICTGKADAALPLLRVNWSGSNSPTQGDVTTGAIGTSHYRKENGVSNLYILGKDNVDTDEFDDHVIAHEFGHYLEDRLYRSDSIGGSHGSGDSLDPRVAFGEGWGNSLSGMTFNDPIYVDSSGVDNAHGFTIDNSAAPTADDRGVYSEGSVQYFLWSLYENRDAIPNSGKLDRIHRVMLNFAKGTDGFTSLQTFAAYYNQEYGQNGESLKALWSDADKLGSPYDSLCVGTCTGTADTADVFDRDNDLGTHYAGVTTRRLYPQATGLGQTADFWRLYRPLAAGRNTATTHDATNFGGYTSTGNKFGVVRWYTLVGTGASMTVAVDNLGGAGSCTDDVMDLYVRRKGVNVAWNDDTSGPKAGCPDATFSSSAGAVYVVEVRGFTTAVPSWDMVIQ